MKKIRQSSITARYTALFFAVIMLLSISISFVLLRFTAERFQEYELANLFSSMEMAVNDLETQYEIFEDIANQIKATYAYRPYVLHQDVYRDIELLEDFTYFRNFSPLLKDYFLLYPEQTVERQKVYTSNGSISYFSIYAQTNRLARAEEVNERYRQLTELTQQKVLLIGDQALLLFPLRFISSESSGDKAVLGILLPLSAMESRMSQVAPHLPEGITVRLDGCLLATEALNLPETSGIFSEGHGRYALCAHSEKGRVVSSITVTLNKWLLLFSTLSSALVIGIALCMLVISCIAALLARAIVRPLRRLIEQHMPQGERFRNEFAQLEALMSRMEQESDSSMHLLRGRLLLSVLRGYYSENLMNRWGILQLHFDKPFYFVAIMDTAALTQEEVDALMRSAEALSDAHALLYAVHVPDDRHVAVIIGMDASLQTETLFGKLQQLTEDSKCFAGKVCETPQLLPISYMEAITAYLRTRKWQSEDLTDMRNFAAQLVSAAERGDEEGMRLLCDQLMVQMDAVQPPRMLLNTLAAMLTTELSILAKERRFALDMERLNMLILLPSMELLMRNVCALVRESFFRQTEGNTSRTEETAQAIVEYVKQNAFDADFDLSRIAERFGLSNDYVSMMIKKITGTAFKEYLTDLRIAQAERLLKEDGTLTVNEISERVGYRKTSNFIKKFKEKYGCTPAQYRFPQL